MRYSGQTRGLVSKIAGIGVLLIGFLLAATLCFGGPADPSQIPSIFRPQSTPADSIFRLSMLVLTITGAIFAVVFCLLVYAISKYRRRGDDDGREPPQVYGSNQVEIAWIVIPVLIVLVLFLVTARVIHSIQDAPQPPGAIEVVAIGHQFWWEFRYPALGVVTANELHVPVSNPSHPTPTFMTLSSADTDHSFWVPRLAGKTDLIPNRVNHMWIEPHETGVVSGPMRPVLRDAARQDATCGYTSIRRNSLNSGFRQKKGLAASTDSAEQGRQIFETTACVNCHAVSGTVADGRFGPDLTHLMSRDTIASGAAPNTPEQLKLWIRNPDAIKPGSLMPAMQLSEKDLDALTEYLETLR